MLNKYPLWKYCLILVISVLGVVYALPNLYPPDPAVQITPAQSGDAVDQYTLSKALDVLDEAQIQYFGEELQEGKTALIRISDEEKQLQAKGLIQRELGDGFIVALNLAPTTPQWLVDMGAGPMTLGLDLSGGVHFLMEVDMQQFLTQRIDGYRDTLKRNFREERLRYKRAVLDEEKRIKYEFIDEETRDKAENFVRREYAEFLTDTRDEEGRHWLVLTMTPAKIKELEDYALKQNLTTIRNRVNELGVAEPMVQRQGRNRIVIELPGVQDTAAAKKILGKAANLEFRLEAKPGASRFSSEEFEFKNPERGRTSARLEKSVIVTGDNVSNAQPAFDENGQPQVNITLDSTGGALMGKVTKKAIKRRMGVLFIEHKTRTRYVERDGVEVPVEDKYTEKKIISLATIQSALGSSFRITGLQAAEASELALLLRAGALAAPMYFVEERTVGPSMGKENIDLGVTSVKLGLALVLIFMIAYYRVFGLIANVALAVNLTLLTAVMSALGATLTLPGIAGIVLTVGMAVDANVLIFARIKEELKSGMNVQQAIHSGYDKAFLTILDANITTLIVAIILFAVGTGPVKGFAVTLSIGIITSMFTAIMVTRALVNLIYGGRRLQKIAIGGGV
ncbi:protein translocase subunit SecD [Bermanella marisrubri]|uniref:Protein translocase subunit SecD n=1 Tax=Bermanella marisrubri TaxID=207949 RepID=Q1MY60_9GAMM|nr:protein translocase subunit SecD [Bermanella marisrubri]EAT10900.1 protein-export membrane protein SecD [Oceanobacter sp. RED65] [Bermanella marisrubri]QIZ85333.1 protein translocase subunit SecD [Bermanella marisrubri]